MMQGLFYYSPSAPLYTYSQNPICQSYLGTNCVAMGSGVASGWPVNQPIPTVAGPRTFAPESDAVAVPKGMWLVR